MFSLFFFGEFSNVKSKLELQEMLRTDSLKLNQF